MQETQPYKVDESDEEVTNNEKFFFRKKGMYLEKGMKYNHYMK